MIFHTHITSAILRNRHKLMANKSQRSFQTLTGITGMVCSAIIFAPLKDTTIQQKSHGVPTKWTHLQVHWSGFCGGISFRPVRTEWGAPLISINSTILGKTLALRESTSFRVKQKTQDSLLTSMTHVYFLFMTFSAFFTMLGFNNAKYVHKKQSWNKS